MDPTSTLHRPHIDPSSTSHHLTSPSTTTSFLLFSLHYHHHISIVFPPQPTYFYCFPSTTTTTTFPLFPSTPPPPPHFYCFPSNTTTTTTFPLFSSTTTTTFLRNREHIPVVDSQTHSPNCPMVQKLPREFSNRKSLTDWNSWLLLTIREWRAWNVALFMCFETIEKTRKQNLE